MLVSNAWDKGSQAQREEAREWPELDPELGLNKHRTRAIKQKGRAVLGTGGAAREHWASLGTCVWQPAVEV